MRGNRYLSATYLIKICNVALHALSPSPLPVTSDGTRGPNIIPCTGIMGYLFLITGLSAASRPLYFEKALDSLRETTNRGAEAQRGQKILLSGCRHGDGTFYRFWLPIHLRISSGNFTISARENVYSYRNASTPVPSSFRGATGQVGLYRVMRVLLMSQCIYRTHV